MEDLGRALDAASAERPAREIQDAVTREDTALYVYTSGTTGAPKAARMVHRRVLSVADRQVMDDDGRRRATLGRAPQQRW